MSKNYKRVIKANDNNDDYVCNVYINDVEYAYENLSHRSIENSDGITKKNQVIDVTTGEVIYETDKNIISTTNSKAHTYVTCCDFAKSKNMPREFVKANGRHIIEICKEKSDYLQASTGSTHEKRGIITVDKDLTLPENIKEKEDVIHWVNSMLEKYFSILNALKLPLPTSYQIHTTNGHFQMFWVLKQEIKIKTLKWSNRFYDCHGRKVAYFDNTPIWEMYMRTLRFLNIIFGGDPAFTGWQIKNMFLDDPIFIDSFKTMWNNNGSWTEQMPSKVVAYNFNKIHNSVMEHIKNPDSSKFKLLSDIMSGFGMSEYELKQLVCGNLLPTKNILTKYGINVVRKPKTDINLGRNQFVRMKTYEVIRAYKNKISMDDARILVKSALTSELKKTGRLKGTKNNGIYSENDFERDFSGTFFHATETYHGKCPYTEEQLERSRQQRISKKTHKMICMLNILEKYPKLTANITKNNRQVLILLKKQGVEIKTTKSIYDYKKELGITTTQQKLYKKNYKFIDKKYDNCIKRYNELIGAYKTINLDMIEKECLEKWEKRLNNVYDKSNDMQFKQKQRTTLKYHTLKARQKEPVEIKFDNDLLKDISLINTHKQCPLSNKHIFIDQHSIKI